MRLVLAVVAALPFVHAAERMLAVRQASSGSAAPSGPATVTSAAATGLTSAPVSASGPPVTFSLLSSNPTAVPLASINGNEPSGPTQPIPIPATAGAIPTFLPGAPPLPDISNFNPALYPPLDKVPDTSSPEVQQWIQEVQNSGITIPDIPPTLPGGCPANPAASSNSSICWWTCSGCTRDTDITDCPDPLTWGLTYDDGPSFYTTELLSYLDQQKLKSTFFVVGSRVVQFPQIAQAEYMDQHQIAVHTYSHPSLCGLTTPQIIAELGWSKKVIHDVLGVTPNQMRPPYGDIDDRVRAISMAMGLTPVMWTRVNTTFTYDTGDFNLHAGTVTPQQVLNNWDNIVTSAKASDRGFCMLEHDLWEQTVQIATGYIIPDGIAEGFKIEPVTICQKNSLADAYIETNNNKTNPPPSGNGAIGVHDPSPTSSTNTGGTGSGSTSTSNSSSSGANSSPNSAPGVFSFSTGGAAAVALTSIVGGLAGMFTIF